MSRALVSLAAAAVAGCGPAFKGDCVQIANAATAQVKEIQVAQQPPVAQGGTLVDGTYVRASTNVYTGAGATAGPSIDTHRQTLVLSNEGTVLKSVDSKNAEADVLLVFSATVGKTAIFTSLVCGREGTLSYGYDATADSLTLYDGSNGTTRAHAFTKL